MTMNRDGLLALYNYNIYANVLLLDVIARLSDAEFRQEPSRSHGSIQKLLIHMWVVEAAYLAYARDGQRDRPPLDTLADIRQAWEGVNGAALDFIVSVAEGQLAQEKEIRLQGHPFRFKTWQLLTQPVIHSIHHRGELCILLSEMEYDVPTLDIVLQFAEQSGQPWPWK